LALGLVAPLQADDTGAGGLAVLDCRNVADAAGHGISPGRIGQNRIKARKDLRMSQEPPASLAKPWKKLEHLVDPPVRRRLHYSQPATLPIFDHRFISGRSSDASSRSS